MEFTPDGRLLILAASEGVRAYAWADLLRAEESLPTPLVSAPSELAQVNSSWLRNTYDFAVDPQRVLVFFSGLDGRVRTLHLETGTITTAIEVPGTPAVTDLALSSDGAALATVSDPGMFDRSTKRPAPVWHVWSLAAQRIPYGELDRS